MPKPACLKCQRFYRPIKNGFMWVESMPIDNYAPPGNEAPQAWAPYKIWHSDLFECGGCGHQLITGHGREPISEHYRKEEFAHYMQFVEGTINDC